MATLEINGRRVEVDDSFRTMTPEMQSQTVDEIAASIGAAPKAQQTQPEITPEQPDIEPYAQRAQRELEAEQGIGGGSINAASSGLNSGMMFGFDDEIGAGMMTPVRMIRDGVGPSEAYKRQVALERARKGERIESNPIASGVGEVIGGIAGGGKLASAGLTIAGKNLPVIGRTGAAAIEGAGYGAAYGAGNADGRNMVDEATKGATIGAITGGVLERGTRAVGNALSKRAMTSAPTQQDLSDQGRKLYNKAEGGGVSVKDGAVKKAAGNLAFKLRSFGFDADLQPKTAVALRKLTGSVDKDLTLSDLDNIRKVASTASREAVDASDRKASGIIVEEIDRIFENPVNFSVGSSEALKSLSQAREVWKRKLKVEVLDDINEKALNQATGYENGLVIQLRSLANNKKRMKMFSKEEQELIKSAVRRGGTRSILKAFGMLSPNSTFGGITAGGIGVGSGILPAAAIAGTGFAAKKGAEALTRNQFGKLTDAAARGFTPQSVTQLPQKARPFIGGATAGTTQILPRQ